MKSFHFIFILYPLLIQVLFTSLESEVTMYVTSFQKPDTLTTSPALGFDSSKRFHVLDTFARE
jgi:hypothetical protein